MVPGTQKTLWPSSHCALGPEKLYGHRLKLAGARIFRELGDSVTRKLKKLAQQKKARCRLQFFFKSDNFEQLVCGGTSRARNAMATEFFVLEPEKRYGHRLKLLLNPKNVMAIDSSCSRARKALWPPTQSLLSGLWNPKTVMAIDSNFSGT